jgi:hypothetical protein
MNILCWNEKLKDERKAEENENVRRKEVKEERIESVNGPFPL